MGSLRRLGPIGYTWFALAVLGLGCTASKGESEPGPSAVGSELALSFSELKGKAEAASRLTAAQALSAYPVPSGALSYTPLDSKHLDTIQASALALSDAELKVLGAQGLVLSTRREFPTFTRGLAAIYSEHLPLYVSADTLLDTVHRAYDTSLLQLEQDFLIPQLSALLAGLRERLAAVPSTEPARQDVDLYLAVASSLLTGQVASPVAGGDAKGVQSMYAQAMAAAGIAQVEFFGQPRLLDFSQFTPRGHYTDSEALSAYFRAMMWLGRIDLRLIETLPDGSEVFRPEQYRAALLLRSLLSPDLPRHERMDAAIRTFVGDSDSMTAAQLELLVADLGGAEAAAKASEEAVVAAIVAGNYGAQQIASHLMVNDGTVKRLPLNRSFLLFGQRYVVDSHVLSEASYDRIPRMMPSPLDAAFAALGNNQALHLQKAELEEVPEMGGALARMRTLVDEHGEAFWDKNLYNLWLQSLRALSPKARLAEGMPEIAGTPAFGRRILNTQLGSYAQLRHDTLLYAKQSYSGIPECAYPDVYVDPYPDFFGALQRYAEAGKGMIAQLAGELPEQRVDALTAYFDALYSVCATLKEMAEYQLRDEPFTEAHMAFINKAVRVEDQSAGCATIEVPDGWYVNLFLDPQESLRFDPTVADIHTQPADSAGNIVGRVLHVGTSYPRMMVVTVDTCEGPKAYVGMAYAYHEVVTEDFERLSDEVWAERLAKSRPAEVPWQEPIVGQ